MKKTLLLMLFISSLISSTFAQQTVFKVQGHPRSDLNAGKVKNQQLRATHAEDHTFTFDDIQFWVGSGSKRAALVIDWYDGKGSAMVWGFKWNGDATGFYMVKAIAKVDPRFLFFTHATGALGNTIAGFGYDLNNNGNQYLVYNGDTDHPHYPVNGIVTTTAYNYDDWTNGDPADHWKSGWYNGYWSYQVKDSQTASFSYSGLGASSRQLQDGSWDGWGYQDFADPSMEGVVPRAPYQAAPAAPTTPIPNYTSYWSEMGKDKNHQAIADKKFARQSNELSEKWKTQLSPLWMNGGQPIIVNGNIYLAINNKVMIIDALTGATLKENTLAGSCGFFSMIAYGEGKIFVPMNNGILQAFNADNLESLWVTQTKTGYQHLCQVVYHDGYVYTGTWKGGAPVTGTYYCVSAADEDPYSTNEIKPYTWESDNTGFYWTGGTVVGNVIIFGGDSGILQSRNRKTGALIDTYQIAPELTVSTIRCGSSYDPTTQRIFFTGKESKKIYGVKIKADGSFDKPSIVSGQALGQATTVPTVYNGRIYATSGTMTSGGGLDVFDANTLQKIYSVNIGGISQSTPLLTTAYATAANHKTVYVYVTLNNASGSLVCIKDFEGNTEPIVQFTYTPSSVQYSTHSLVSDDNGIIYYKNDAKYLVALESHPSTDVAGISLNRNTQSIENGKTFQLSASITPYNATNKAVSWSSSDDAIATVDNNGVVTGVSAGTATITARSQDGGFAAVCSITIINPATGISLSETTANLRTGNTLTLVATVTPIDATDKSVTWSSSNTSVATVSNGTVTAVSAGTATIKVMSVNGGFAATCVVTVTDPDINVTGISFNQTTTAMISGNTLILMPTVVPSNATNRNLLWSSDNENVVTVDENGVATAISQGEANITVRTVDGNYTAVCKITVSYPTSIETIAGSGVKVYPTVTTGAVHIVQPEMNQPIQIIDYSGRIVHSETLQAGESTINMYSYNKGVYFIKVGSTITKVIKQ